MNLLETVINRLFAELELQGGEFYYADNVITDAILDEIDSSGRIDVNFDCNSDTCFIREKKAHLVLVGKAEYWRYCGKDEGEEIWFPSGSYKYKCLIEVPIEIEEGCLDAIDISQLNISVSVDLIDEEDDKKSLAKASSFTES